MQQHQFAAYKTNSGGIVIHDKTKDWFYLITDAAPAAITSMKVITDKNEFKFPGTEDSILESYQSIELPDSAVNSVLSNISNPVVNNNPVENALAYFLLQQIEMYIAE